jgi:hypothetical protein
VAAAFAETCAELATLIALLQERYPNADA